MKKIEKLTINDLLKNHGGYLEPILQSINDLIDNQKEIIDKVDNQCKDCGYIAPLKKVWDNPEKLKETDFGKIVNENQKLQMENQDLKQQLTENSAHSAGVINNLEAENKQLKSSQIKVDDKSVEWLKDITTDSFDIENKYVRSMFKFKAERLLKQIRGE